MSIASPKLSPIILSTNNNGKNQTNSSPTSIKKEFNNNNTSRTSNGNDSIKSSINHKKESLPDSPSKRKIRVLHSSDESDDDDKPLVINSLFTSKFFFFVFLGQKSRGYKWSKFQNISYNKKRINTNNRFSENISS